MRTATSPSAATRSPPEEQHITLTIERLDDGEVSPYVAEALQPGDQLGLLKLHIESRGHSTGHGRFVFAS